MKSTIYQGHIGYGRSIVWYDTYIHLSLQHQLVLPGFERNSGWSVVTYIQIYKNILRNYERKSGWSQNTYVHNLCDYEKKIG